MELTSDQISKVMSVKCQVERIDWVSDELIFLLLLGVPFTTYHQQREENHLNNQTSTAGDQDLESFLVSVQNCFQNCLH